MLVLRRERCVGEVINVGTGKPTTVNEFVNVLMELFQETGARYACMSKYVPPRAGDIRHSCADISKAERALGYAPRIGLEEGTRRLLQSSDVKAIP